MSSSKVSRDWRTFFIVPNCKGKVDKVNDLEELERLAILESV